jgi:ABC-type polysaccharide/polyol phosphate export permease
MTIAISGPRSLRRFTTSALTDICRGALRHDVWGRLGWLEIKRRYQRTVLGPFWGTLSYAIFVLAYGAVGAGLWRQNMADFLPFLASGMLVWMFISSLLVESGSVFVSTANIFRQIRIDYSLLVYVLLWRNVIAFGHNLVFYLLLIVFLAPADCDMAMLLAIPGMALLLLNGFWVVLLLGMFCLRFRDMQPFVSSIVTIFMFVTPLFWPPESLMGTDRAFLVSYNPIYHFIEIVRSPLLGEVPSIASYETVAAICVAGWLLTFFVFRRFRERIPYWA